MVTSVADNFLLLRATTVLGLEIQIALILGFIKREIVAIRLRSVEMEEGVLKRLRFEEMRLMKRL